MAKFVFSTTILMMVMLSLLVSCYAEDGIDLGGVVDEANEESTDASLTFGPQMLLVLAVGALAALL